MLKRAGWLLPIAILLILLVIFIITLIVIKQRERKKEGFYVIDEINEALGTETCLPDNQSSNRLFKFKPINSTNGKCYYVAASNETCPGTEFGMGLVNTYYGPTLDEPNSKKKCVYDDTCSTTPFKAGLQQSTPEPGSSGQQANAGNFFDARYLERGFIDCKGQAMQGFQLANQYKEGRDQSTFSYNYTCASQGPSAAPTPSTFSIQTPMIPFELANTPNTDGFMGSTLQLPGINFKCSDDSVLGSYRIECDHSPVQQNIWRGAYSCVPSANPLACRQVVTDLADIGSGGDVNPGGLGSMNYLDRHNIACEPDEALQQVQLISQYPVNNTINYQYTCCKAACTAEPVEPGPVPGGSYADSCSDCTMTGTVLTCQCAGPGGKNYTSVDTDRCQKAFGSTGLANMDGYLVCNGEYRVTQSTNSKTNSSTTSIST